MQGHIPLRPDRMGTSAPSVWFSKTSQLFFHLFPASYSVISLPPLYAPSLLFPLAFHGCCVCLVDVWQCMSEAPSTVRPCLNSGRKRDIKYGPLLHYYVIITIHNPCSHLPAKKFESWQKLSFSYHLNASLFFFFTPAPAFDWFHNYLMTILTLIPPP